MRKTRVKNNKKQLKKMHYIVLKLSLGSPYELWKKYNDKLLHLEQKFGKYQPKWH